MKRAVIIEDAGGSREVAHDAFPLSVGGPGAVVALPGMLAGEPVAWIGREEDELFLQAGERGVDLTCNGEPVTTSQWLRDGDRLRIGTAAIAVDEVGGALRLRVEKAAQRPDEPVLAVTTVQAPAGSDATVRPVDFQPRRRAGTPRRRRGMRPVKFAVAALLLLFALAAWFVLTARSVEILVDPPPDRVDVSGGFSGIQVGGRYLLRPGTYTLSAEKEGYRRLETSLDVGHDSGGTFRFTLEKLPGLLAVLTVDGSTVVIDGHHAGTTPMDPVELAVGDHEVWVVSDRYLEHGTTVSIEGGGVTQTLEPELTPLWAAITFQSTPAGATVSADSEKLGVTPVTVDLDAGEYRLEYRLPGHKPLQDALTVEANQPQTLLPVSLELQDGKLLLDSNPSGAMVTVNGDYAGQTPLELYLEPNRPHEVGISRAGHVSETRVVAVRAGGTETLTVSLQQREGEVEVVVHPADAQVLVNGEARGSGVLTLPAVPHEIEVRKEGFQTYRTTVTPRPGVAQTVRVQLEAEAPPEPERPAALPARIETSQGQAMALIHPGPFRMGASRREPGRRANESLRQVELTRTFYMAVHEVSNRQFREFRPGHSSGLAGDQSLDRDDYPVVQVTWEDAALYCNWLSEKESLPLAYADNGVAIVAIHPPTRGYRLPLEAEWAWAARYARGSTPLKYPWGQVLPVAPGSGNFADISARGLVARVLSGYDDTFPATAPVDSFGPNERGLAQMGGNVTEWVHDLYTIYPSGNTGVARDPTGPEEGELHTIRGSSWMDSSISELRLTYRDYGKKARRDLGFRIVRYAE